MTLHLQQLSMMELHTEEQKSSKSTDRQPELRKVDLALF
jgi:hypothetical protein